MSDFQTQWDENKPQKSFAWLILNVRTDGLTHENLFKKKCVFSKSSKFQELNSCFLETTSLSLSLSFWSPPSSSAASGFDVWNSWSPQLMRKVSRPRAFFSVSKRFSVLVGKDFLSEMPVISVSRDALVTLVEWMLFWSLFLSLRKPNSSSDRHVSRNVLPLKHLDEEQTVETVSFAGLSLRSLRGFAGWSRRAVVAETTACPELAAKFWRSCNRGSESFLWKLLRNSLAKTFWGIKEKNRSKFTNCWKFSQK